MFVVARGFVVFWCMDRVDPIQYEIGIDFWTM
jgi:hypothetical protein